jgi:hypothetical protein
LCNPHHNNGDYEHWYSNQPEEPHNDVHATSSILLIAAWIVKELGTIEVTTGEERKTINRKIIIKVILLTIKCLRCSELRYANGIEDEAET